MIKSMTGFGKTHFLNEELNFNLEVKTVNSRFLDINIRMPYQLNFLEDKINKLIKKYISRGRVDIFIRSKNKAIGNTAIKVDLDLAKDMGEKLQEIAKQADISKDKISLNDILRNEDVLVFEPEELDDDFLEKIVLGQLEEVLKELVDMRTEEGKNLHKDLSSNLNDLKENLDKVKELAKDIKQEIKDKLYKSINENIDSKLVDEDRLAVEIVYYADKQDINEEITRLYSHIDQFNKHLEADGPIGKKLDFISQEMLRETNTIASKSQKLDLINITIEMKTIIEKIKEQVQNIE